MKPLVIHHSNCADGFGAAFAAWLKFGDEAEYLPMQYGTLDTPVALAGTFDCTLAERDVYILDFSLKRPGMDWMFKNAGRVVWLDHHKTAFEMWCGLDYLTERRQKFTQSEIVTHSKPISCDIILDNNRSGALIAWDYFHPGKEVPMLFRHIDDYDRWQFKLDGTKAFNKALWSHTPWSFEQWKRFAAFDPYGDPEMLLPECFLGYSRFIAEGEAILRAHDQNVQSVANGAAMECRLLKAKPKPGGEHWEALFPVNATGLAANCPPHLTSDVGHELATQSGTFGLCWHLGKDGKAKCSLRSNGDYDVSAIAKAFGGGGHKNAAGFETDVYTLMGWLK